MIQSDSVVCWRIGCDLADCVDSSGYYFAKVRSIQTGGIFTELETITRVNKRALIERL